MIKSIISFALTLLTSTFLQAQVTSQTVEIPNTSVNAIDGIGWASAVGTNMVSGNIYWTYIDPAFNAVVAKKTVAGVVTTKIIMTGVTNDDNHAEMSLGVDNEGYIHVIGGQHNSAPNYYVSTNPDDISSFTFRGNDTTIGGFEGIQITYQSFTRSNKGTLFLNCRSNMIPDFTTGCRALALGRYDTRTKKWTMIGGENYSIRSTDCSIQTGAATGLTAFVWNNSGVGDMRPIAPACSAFAHYQGYQLKILFDQNNGMHISYNMADSINCSGDVSQFMTHLFYAFSPDEGTTWFKANGQQLNTFPITKATGDLVTKRYPAGYVYPAIATEGVFTNSSDLLLDIDGAPLVIQWVIPLNKNLFFKWNGTSWADVTSNYTYDNSRLYSNLIRKETYCFGNGQTFKMSRDYMSSWINTVALANTTDWYSLIDKYYLQKTGNVRYYARNSTIGTAGVVTLQTAVADNEPPIAPTSLIAYNLTQASFALDWSTSTDVGVVSYEVFNDATLVATVGTTYYNFSGLTPTQTYSITVKAKDAAGNLSLASTPLSVTMLSVDAIVPTAPSGLSSSGITTNSFVLTWSGLSADNVGVTGYEAYHGTTLIGSSTGSSNSMNIYGLAENTTYNVTLKAKDYAGNRSTASTPISVTTASNGLIVYESFNYSIGSTLNDPDVNVNLGNGLPATNSTGVPSGVSTGIRGVYGAEYTTVAGLNYENLLSSGSAACIKNATWGAGMNFYRSMTNDPYLAQRIGGVNTANFGVDGKTLYVSFIAQTNSSTANSFNICLSGGNNVFIQNTAAGKWSLSDNANVPVASTATVELNTPTLLVVKYDFVAGIGDVVSLYKNPILGQALGTADATVTTAANFAGFGGLQTRPSVANAMTFDEFRMGTTLLAVLPKSIVTPLTNEFIQLVVNSCVLNGKIITNFIGTQGSSSVTIFDAHGRVIKNCQTTEPQISTQVATAGIYFVRVINSGKSFSQKILVQ